MNEQATNNLQGKNVVIGITGGIAAYKTADLSRRLMELGADVRVVMTTAATEFVTPLTFQALCGHPVFFDNSDDSATSGMKHIELARWADAIIVAPASANTIAKLAHGRADNLLTTLCLASEAIKCFAPAMNRVMWDDLSTQANCRTLVEKQWHQFGPASGSQACGETGEGRMVEVSEMLCSLQQCFSSGDLSGVNVVVTAGPTYEAIDPVRYISNRSSGRMGYEIARASQQAGAKVTLISGPTHLTPPERTGLIRVESAEEMKQVVLDNLTHCDVYISTAAVSDYRVEQVATHKIKKTEDKLTLQLTRNDDIVSMVANNTIASHGSVSHGGANHVVRPYVVGFAAETENVIDNARDKLARKNLDMIVANDVSNSSTDEATPAIGFNSDYNALHVLWNDGQTTSERHFDVARKAQLATQLISLIAEQYKVSQSHAKDTA